MPGRQGQARDRVAAGGVDIAWDVQGRHPGNCDKSAVVEQPFQFTNAAEGGRAFQAIHDAGMLEGEYTDVKLPGLFTFPNAALMLVEPLESLAEAWLSGDPGRAAIRDAYLVARGPGDI